MSDGLHRKSRESFRPSAFVGDCLGWLLAFMGLQPKYSHSLGEQSVAGTYSSTSPD